MEGYPQGTELLSRIRRAKEQVTHIKIDVLKHKDTVKYFETLAMQDALVAYTEKELSNDTKRNAAMQKMFDANPDAVAAKTALREAEFQKMREQSELDILEDAFKELQAQRIAWELLCKEQIADSERRVASKFEAAYTQLNQAMQARLQSSQRMGGKP